MFFYRCVSFVILVDPFLLFIYYLIKSFILLNLNVSVVFYLNFEGTYFCILTVPFIFNAYLSIQVYPLFNYFNHLMTPLQSTIMPF